MVRVVCFTLVTALLTAGPSFAFVICETDDGERMAWDDDNRLAEFVFAVQGADGQLPMLTEEALRDSMRPWAEIADADFRFGDVGYAEHGSQQYDFRNIVYFLESQWIAGPEVIALTTNQFWDTGEIIEADMELNAVDYTWTVFDDEVITDLRSIGTHEFGHSMGLCHSPTEDATMFANYNDGETFQRDLHEDDIAGAVELYPCSCPGCCSTDVEMAFGRGGCVAGGGSNSGPSRLVLLIMASLLVARNFRGSGRSGQLGTLAALALLPAAGLTATPAAATTLSLSSVDDLASRSSLIVRATVEDVAPYEDAVSGNVRTRALLTIEETLKGELHVGASISVDSVGGTVDGRGTFVEGAARLETGQHVLLFLDPLLRPVGGAPRELSVGLPYRVVGLEAGVWDVRWRGSELTLEPRALARRQFGKQALPGTVAALRKRLDAPRAP